MMAAGWRCGEWRRVVGKKDGQVGKDPGRLRGDETAPAGRLGRLRTRGRRHRRGHGAHGGARLRGVTGRSAAGGKAAGAGMGAHAERRGRGACGPWLWPGRRPGREKGIRAPRLAATRKRARRTSVSDRCTRKTHGGSQVSAQTTSGAGKSRTLLCFGIEPSSQAAIDPRFENRDRLGEEIATKLAHPQRSSSRQGRRCHESACRPAAAPRLQRGVRC